MDTYLTSIIVAFVALALVIYSLVRTKEPVNFDMFQKEFSKALPHASEIVEIVQSAVFAAEQLKRTGKLPDNNAAFDYALEHAQKLLPSLDRETLTVFIEGAVLLTHDMSGGGDETRGGSSRGG